MAEFNPKDHLIQIRRNEKYKDRNGRTQYREVLSDYLPARHRLRWLLEDYPAAYPLVEFENVGSGLLAKCEITISRDGYTVRGIAHAYESSAIAYERAETRAIGRACAHLGYGTEWSDSSDEVIEHEEKLARQSAPAQRQPARQSAPAQKQAQRTAPKQSAPASETFDEPRAADEILSSETYAIVWDLYTTSKMNPAAVLNWVRRFLGDANINGEMWPDEGHAEGIIQLLTESQASMLAEHLERVQK